MAPKTPLLRMLKESPRKVTCDHASLGVGKNGVRYCTVHPIHWLLRWKTNYFFASWMLADVSWMLIMLFRKTEFGVPGFPFFRHWPSLHPWNFPERHVCHSWRSFERVQVCGPNPAAVSNPQTAANKLDVQLQFLTRSASCGSCQVLAIQLNSRQAFRWTMKRVHLDVDSEEKRLQCDLFARVMCNILFYSAVLLTAALTGQCDLAGSAFTAMTSRRNQFE